ncbi:pantetheine-phosphate adenylyltransferase [Marinilabilia sp.]|jgi:pantetheine-phosphate adenylyltransferase
MQKTAIFPGSFDPFTVGHENIVRRGLSLVDKIYIAIGYNSQKKDFFPLEQRIKWIKQVFDDEPRIEVVTFQGLTVDFAKELKCNFILRGIRTSADFEYERAIAQVNKSMSGIDTVFLLTSPEHTPVNSSIVRDILKHGGDASKFIPDKIDINITSKDSD